MARQLCSGAATIRVLLVLDDQDYCWRTRGIVASSSDLRVVAEASNRHELMAAVEYCVPQVVVIAGQSACDATLTTVRQIRRRNPQIKTVFLAESANSLTAAGAMEADAFLADDPPNDEIIRAIRKVAGIGPRFGHQPSQPCACGSNAWDAAGGQGFSTRLDESFWFTSQDMR